MVHRDWVWLIVTVYCVPPSLQPGDLLYVVSPSGTLRECESFQAGLDIWRSRGYQVTCVPGYDGRWGYLAGTDEQRRHQLEIAINDPECKGILASRGGYGGSRLLEDWQWPLALQSSPKWLVGFSDVTSLLWSLSAQGISGVHGPLLTTLAHEPSWSVERLWHWVEGGALDALNGKPWSRGRAIAPLFPANLTVATHLLSTAHQPPLDGIILAFEDVSEAPYRIDRMLTQWRMTGAFDHIAGIALGRFSRCDPPKDVPSFSVAEVLRDRLSDLDIPIVADLPFGHDGVNACLPVGVTACLDANEGTLSWP
ncbi:MAG: LD-carboxypeptidase, partial [Cyanobacteria bacterium P01_E01_bin.6]